MKTPLTILVSPYLTPCPVSLKYRWRASLVEHAGPVVLAVEGFLKPDDAIGALVFEAAERCGSKRHVAQFIAGLFGDLARHTAEVQLGRAIRIAARHPDRRNPGCVVVIETPGDAQPAPAIPANPKPVAAHGRPRQLLAKGGVR